MKEVRLDLSKSLVLLDGPNGYGKSTVFDAMELLLTGKIEHSAKGKVAVLANNKEYDISIKGILEYGNELVQLGRNIKADSQFEKEDIYWNDVLITQEELYGKLNFSKSSMGVAIYVSQLKSLNYLEKKEKDRKQVVADLIDDNRFNTEIMCLGEFEKKLKQKLDAEQNELLEKIRKESGNIDKLSGQIKAICEIQGKKGYEKLFEAKDYGFDKEYPDKSIGYSEMIKPLEDIKSFLHNYDNYKNSIRNLVIQKVLGLNESQLKAFFYGVEINTVRASFKLYQDIEKLVKMVTEKKVNDINEINQLLPIEEAEQEAIKNVVEKRENLKATSAKNDKCVIRFNEKRKQLFTVYKDGIENELWKEKACPFCGQENEKLEELFQKTEETLKENNKIIIESIQKLEEKIDQYYKARAVEVEELVKNNLVGYRRYQMLKDFLKTEIGKEEKNILEEKKFYCVHPEEKEEFQKAALELKNGLEEEQRSFSELLEFELMGKYDSIVKEYYSERKCHTLEQINDKIAYIADYYSDDYQKALNVSYEKIKSLKEELNKKVETNKIMTEYTEKYFEKYKEALKDYRTKLVERIKIPLYVYSGKVIQNYPMGLGVIAKIKSTQIVFETEKKDEDIFEYLSAGQLNGVMLSIMLAVRSVMDLDKSINLIMIDDPLQTIDDVSAFSYADLLAEQFGDAQIILSTHEADKSDLLEFKFRQHERTVIKYNMHDKYLVGE